MSESGRPGPRWLGPALALLTLSVYAPVLTHEFVGLDDDLYVLHNPRVQAGLDWSNVGWAFTSLEAGFWHPLTWLSHMLDCQLFGLEAGLHHLSSLLIHSGNVLLLFWLLHRMTGALWPAALVALLFGLHPLNVESVAWVAERKNVLSTLFALLAAGAYVGYLRQPNRKRYLALIGLFLLSLMAKPMLVTLPCLFLVLDYWPLGRLGTSLPDVKEKLPRRLYEKGPLFLLILPVIGLALLAEGRIGALGSLEQFPMQVRLANAAVAYTSYLSKLLWPAYLAPFYPHPGDTLPVWQWSLSLLVLSGISALVLAGWRAFPYLPAGWLWYLGTLFPVSGVIQVGGHAMADRYAYFPLIGVFIMIVWGAADCLRQWNIRVRVWGPALVGLLLVLALNTRLQVQYWKDSVALFEHTIRATGNNHLAHNNLGTALLERGRTDEAMAHFWEALRIRPQDATALYNLGLAWRKEGDLEQAARCFSRALELNPQLAAAANNLGTIALHRGKLEAALGHFRQALRIAPDFAEAHDNLGTVLARKGEVEAAIVHFRRSLQIRPGRSRVYSNLGAALDLAGRSREAARYYRRALELDPSSDLSHYNLGLLLLETGELSQAEHHLSQAVRLNVRLAEAHYHLGLVRLRLGRPARAGRSFRRVLELDPDHAGARDQLRLLSEPPRERAP